MLDLFTTDQQDAQSPLQGALARSTAPTIGEAFSAAKEANNRVNSLDAEYQNQRDYFRQRMQAFTTKTGVALPGPQDIDNAPDDFTDRPWIAAVRAKVQAEAQARNDPTLADGFDDSSIAVGGLALARGAVRRQAELSSGASSAGAVLGSVGASAEAGATDPLNAVSLALAPEGGPLLASALRMAGAMGAQTAVGDILHYGYRRQVDPSYGVGDVLGDVAGGAAAGALFGAGSALGGGGIRGALGAAAGGAIGGAALGGATDGSQGALEGALGGAALPLAGAGFGLSARGLGMSWRALVARSPDFAASLPLEVRDAGAVAEKAGDLQAQNPWPGAAGDAAHAEAVSKVESDLVAGRTPELPASAQVEAQARRGQVFYPGGAIDARYDLAELGDLVTSHDGDFAVNPAYPPELQPRDRGGVPARDQVNAIASDLQPERLGPSPEANSGAPIVGPDGVVESGNGRTLTLALAYEQGRDGPYRQWLERQGYDTTGYDRPVLVGVRETPMDAAARADFAHATNGSAALRMSATEQALSDARHLEPGLVDMVQSPDLAAAGNRDFARAFVAKLPAGERGGMLTRDGALSANGVRRAQAAMTARAYGDSSVLTRAFDHPDPNIKAIAGALTDAAGPWARMRDAATRGDIAPGHDITGDVMQAVRAVMRARDEQRPAWEVLNQGDMFQSDTTQLAARMLFRDEEMRQPAGRARVAEALTSYAEEAAKNTVAGRLFADDVGPADVLRQATARAVGRVRDLLDTGAQEVLAMVRAYHGTPHEFDRFDLSKIGTGEGAQSFGHGLYFAENEDIALHYRDALSRERVGGGQLYKVVIDREPGHFIDFEKPLAEQSAYVKEAMRKIGFDPTSEFAEDKSRPLTGSDYYDQAGYHFLTEKYPDASPSDLLGVTDHVGALTSRRLAEHGIAGIRYFDAGSRAQAEGRRNYVVFDDKDVKITHKNGEPVAAAEREQALASMRREPEQATAKSSADQPALTVHNPTTGATVEAVEAGSLRDMLKRFDVSRDSGADVLTRAYGMGLGKVLSTTVGDVRVNFVTPDAMRTIAEGRLKLAPGTTAEAIYDRATNQISVLEDLRGNPEEMTRVLMHEGLHAALMRTINGSSAAAEAMYTLLSTARAAHLARGGDLADHYGLSSVHEFVSEAGSNPAFQRVLAAIPADARIAEAFGLDTGPGHSLWDAFVGAVRKLLGLAPDQHTLLDAAMRGTRDLFQERARAERESGSDVMASVRRVEPDAVAEEEAAKRARSFSDAKDAISYRINADRIAQHPNGPLAGFLGILTRDIHEKGGINVEAVQQDYQGRMADAVEKILEPYGSKWAGLKQDVAGIRDVIHEVFGVDTGNATAKAAGEAWRTGIDTFATGEARRLGKVFTPAEDWRVPQFWESSRAQKFGKTVLLGDMQREIDAGGLRVFDPDTHEEANPLRRQAILDGAADKIVTDASLGGTPGASGSFRTDMRVFRFADGAAGAESYLRLMDKYGAGRGGYLQMMEAHVGKVARELGLARVLGPGWADTGEKLLQDALLADRRIKAARAPRNLADRLRDLRQDTGRFLTSWLESPAKAEAVWQHMSGQASGVGSELMAGLMSETRAFMTSTRMGSALVTAVPADTVNWLMAAKHNGMDMGRVVSGIADAFLKDNPEKREEAARLGIVAHAGMDAAIGTKRFEDQFVGERVMKRLADFVIRAQGLHAWDSAVKRVFPMEFLGTIAQRAGKSLEQLDEPFANFLDRYGLTKDWDELSKPEHALEVGEARYLHPDNLPEPLRVKLMSAIYDERQFAYLAGGSERVRATSASAKAGTLPGELARSVFLFKSFPMTMLSTWGMRAAHEAGAGRIGTLATLVTGMTMAGALAMQARSILQGKDPRDMKDPYFWGESFLQGGAAGIYGDFFKEAFSRSDTSLTETMMGPLAAIPAGIQGLTSGARRAAEDGERVNFGAKLARLLSQNTPGGNLWYARLIASRLVFDNIQRMIDRDHAASFARQQQRALKTSHQGFFWAPGQAGPNRAPDLGAMLQ